MQVFVPDMVSVSHQTFVHATIGTLEAIASLRFVIASVARMTQCVLLTEHATYQILVLATWDTLVVTVNNLFAIMSSVHMFLFAHLMENVHLQTTAAVKLGIQDQIVS